MAFITIHLEDFLDVQTPFGNIDHLIYPEKMPELIPAGKTRKP